MDGVLADFFGALAEEFFVDHWKEIEDIDCVLEALSGTSFLHIGRTLERNRKHQQVYTMGDYFNPS
jgi:hypothetical protein